MLRFIYLIGAWFSIVCWFSSNGNAVADEQVSFRRDILPILAENCFACHGFDEKQRQASLRLDDQASSIAVLESGMRAIVPGELQASQMWLRITSNQTNHRMPPLDSGKKLSLSQIEKIGAWIMHGAVFESHWAFSPPKRVEPPIVGRAQGAVDRFIHDRLQQERLSPSPETDRATLIRRVSLDLTGLPPTPWETDAFLHDTRQDAYARVVDRLLESEHYGERWGRWWLDLAHYGDSDGYLQDFLRPVAWRYRQWVIDAFNQDLPFDEFTIQQIAGDLLPNATIEQKMGTGFFRNTLSNREGGADLEEFRVRQVVDRTSTFGTTWLGLTIGCAQCHDHKFDPISQKEFYQLYAYFNNADEANIDAPLPGEWEAYQLKKVEYERKRLEAIAPYAVTLESLQSEWEKKILYTESHPNEDFGWDRALELLGLQWGQNLGEGQLEGLNIIKLPKGQRTREQSDRLTDYFLKSPPPEFADKFKQEKLHELRANLERLGESLPRLTRAPSMIKSSLPRETHVHIRGDYLRPGIMVSPCPPALFGSHSSHGAQDRLNLARWVASKNNPLTARVVVNRLWQELFGRGLVSTPENLGLRGSPPSHPELLDWLAIEFMEKGWSIKSMLRTIIMSETYRQSSKNRLELETRDPQNVLLARQVRLRLPAELIRDSALMVSGLLNQNVGGPSVKPPQPSSVSQEAYKNEWKESLGFDRYRRGIYTFIQRTSPYAQFVTFDLPDTSRCSARRERSNTPLQALNLLNDPVFMEAATALAKRVRRTAGGSDRERLARAFEFAINRPPTVTELNKLEEYLHKQRMIDSEKQNSIKPGLETSQDIAAEPEWILACSVLFNLDEFIHRE